MKLYEIMTREPESINSGESLQKAAEKMKHLDVGTIPVFGNDTPVGMLTDRDIAVRAIAEGKDAQAPVGEVMTPRVVDCSEDTDAEEALKIMEKEQVRRLMIKNDQGRMVGLIALGDLAFRINEAKAGEAIRKVSRKRAPQPW